MYSVIEIIQYSMNTEGIHERLVIKGNVRFTIKCIVLKFTVEHILFKKNNVNIFQIGASRGEKIRQHVLAKTA